MLGLEAVDYIGGSAGYVSGYDDSFLYTIVTTNLYRRTSRLAAPELIFDFSTILAALEPRSIWAFNSGLFALTTNYIGTTGIYKSTDHGISWTLVCNLSGKSLLPRGMCEDLSGNIYYGTYQVDDSGSILGKSTDGGDTFSNVATWTSAYVRHIHAVVHNAGSIYICFGDTGDETGILKWDGSAFLTSDALPKDYTAATHGADGIGDGQAYRTCDLLFFGGKVYYIADTTGNADAGIYRMNTDLTGVEQIDTQIQSFLNHSGYLGLTLNGALIFSEFLEDSDPAITDLKMNLWCSEDGDTWSVGGTFLSVANSSGGGLGLLEYQGEGYFSKSGAGKENLTSAVFTTSQSCDKDNPNILHPVYWVSKTGSNAQSGYRPTTPWLTVQYALIGDRITNGARVIVGAGAFEEANILLDFDGNARPGNSDSLTVVEGQGSDLTRIFSNTTKNYLFYVEEAEVPVKFKKFMAYTTWPGTSAAKSTIFSLLTQTLSKGDIVCEDLIIGNQQEWARAFATSAGVSLKVVRTKINLATVGGNVCVPAGTGNVEMMFSEVLSTSVVCSYSVAGFYLSIVNSVLAGFTATGVFYSGAANQIPKIKNTIFSPAVGATYSLYDSGTGLVETDSEIDYNVYFGVAPGGLTNSGGSHSLTSDPKFVDAAGGDFRLQSSSPCRNSGIVPFVDGNGDKYDMAGEKVWDDTTNLPVQWWLSGVDIGAYAYQFVVQRPDVEYPGPLGIDGPFDGATFPTGNFQAPLGGDFQAISTFTNGAEVDLATLVPTTYVRTGPLGTLVYSAELDAAGILRADRVVGA